MGTGGRAGQYATGWSLHCSPPVKKRGVLWRQFRKRRVESCKLSVVVLQTRTKVVGRVPRDKSIAGGPQHPAT